jgi:hypothetical protein
MCNQQQLSPLGQVPLVARITTRVNLRKTTIRGNRDQVPYLQVARTGYAEHTLKRPLSVLSMHA